MKVFALGGYGKVGFPAIKLLAQIDLVTEIAIVGRSLKLAEKVAREIGEKAIAIHADGTDEKNLISLLAGYDIIMNAAADKTVLPAIRAAVGARTHYCDAAVVTDQTLQLAPEAATAGITSIVANGISPCISNLMGMHAASQLEEVEQLQLLRADIFNWQSGREVAPHLWLKDPQENLAALHEFKPFITWMLSRLQNNGIRTMCVYDHGHWVEMDPIRNGLEVPIKQGSTITYHPYVSGDPLWGSLSSDLSRVPPIEVWFSPFPPQLHNLLREQALLVLGKHVDSDTAVSSFYETFESDPHRWLTLHDDFTPIPKMCVSAVGRKEGRAARYSYWFTAPMWNVGGYFLTSVALVVAVLKILRGEIEERGVMTAEKAFEPLPFLDEVASLITESLPDGKMLGETFDWLE